MDTNYVVASQENRAGVPRYTDEIDVPLGLRTAAGWRSRYRKLNGKASPKGEVKDRESQFYFRPLYAAEDTGAMTEKERSVEYLWRLFVAPHNGNRHIKYAEDKGDWITVTEQSKLRRFEAAHMRRGDLEAHLYHRKLFGVFGGRKTRWVAIDADMHDTKKTPLTPERKALFVEMLPVLLSEFHGGGWHVQVKDRDAGGVHLIQVLPRRLTLEAAVDELRRRLRCLDERNPALVARAQALGMKTFAQMELYPDPNHGFRLPLARERTMLLDRPLATVKNKKGRSVGDVIGYARWLHDAGREYMPSEESYQYVVERLANPPSRIVLPPSAAPATSAPAAQAEAAKGTGNPDKLPQMRGNFRKNLVEFWTGQVVPKGVLNAWIKMLTRCLHFEVGRDQAVEVIERYCDEIPDKSISSRLTVNRPELSRYVACVVKNVYENNGYQPEPERSTLALKKTMDSWHTRGFFVSDKATWHPVVCDTSTLSFEWTQDEIVAIEKHVLPVLKLRIKDETSRKSRPPRDQGAELRAACALVKEIVQTVYRYRHGEVASTLLNTIIERHGVKLGSGHAKRTKLMARLELMDWVTVRTAMWAGKRARGYQIGPKLLYKTYYSPTAGEEEASISSTTFLHESDEEAVEPMESEQPFLDLLPTPK